MALFRTLAMLPIGAMLVNVGRGWHVVDSDLIATLDSGQLEHVALDAPWPEPLPPESPLWLHPKVTVLPHVARRPTVRQLVTEIAANIRSVRSGGGLLQPVRLELGIECTVDHQFRWRTQPGRDRGCTSFLGT